MENDTTPADFLTETDKAMMRIGAYVIYLERIVGQQSAMLMEAGARLEEAQKLNEEAIKMREEANALLDELRGSPTGSAGKDQSAAKPRSPKEVN